MTEVRPPSTVDVVIVGAGFAGMYMLHRLRGLGMSARVFEAGSGVGGTWYWNRYPGARCDVESMQYSYSFSPELQQEWQWSELFASQPEILRYANHVADRFDLRRDIQFNTRVTQAHFDRTAHRWEVRTDRGDVVSARHCVMATGCLSNARVPDFPGLDRFNGKTYHTGHWPHEGVDFTGKRVGVIGTGSSAIQAIPVIAQQAAHVTVFQRTPNFSIPSRNDLIFDAQANDTAANFVRDKIRAMVRDPAIAELLAPKNHPIGTKRICVDTDYYTTYNRDNVTLVDARTTPVSELTEGGLRAGDTEYEFDAIVFATGFDAMTGALTSIDIAADGMTLRQKWEGGPTTYLGLMTAGFPNLFMITGPGSPSVLSNMMVSIEQHVDWIADCVAYLRAHRLDCIEATQAAEDAWVAHGNEVAHTTLYPLANSWYMGVNIPGKPQVFMPYIGGVGTYRDTCDEIAAEGYRGFTLSAREAALAAE
jgi:cyclohexanone monooxygenase